MALLLGGEVLGLAQVVRRSVRAKAGVVGEDFREGGRRAILNFGHTYGHALRAGTATAWGTARPWPGACWWPRPFPPQRGLLAGGEAEAIYRDGQAPGAR